MKNNLPLITCVGLISGNVFADVVVTPASPQTVNSVAAIGTALTFQNNVPPIPGASAALTVNFGSGPAVQTFVGMWTIDNVNAVFNIAAGDALNMQSDPAALNNFIGNVSIEVNSGTLGLHGDVAAGFTENIVLNSSATLNLMNNADLSQATVLTSSVNASLLGNGEIKELGGAGANAFIGIISPGDSTSNVHGEIHVLYDATFGDGSRFISSLFPHVVAPGSDADFLNVDGTVHGISNVALQMVYNPAVTNDMLVPVNGFTLDYTFIAASAVDAGAFKSATLTLIDPLTGRATNYAIDPTGVDNDSAGLSVTLTNDGAHVFASFTGESNVAFAGTTNTNIGVVDNSQLNALIDQLNFTGNIAGASTDTMYVSSALLLMEASQLPGAMVTAAAPANPNALPNTTFNSMTQAGSIAKMRLMEMRGGAIGNAAALANGQDTFAAPTSIDEFSGFGERTNARDVLAQASTAVTEPAAVNAGINGSTNTDGARAWARGYGFYEDVSSQSYSQGSYTASMGGLMAGMDVGVENGILLGGFVGFTPGSMTTQTTLGNTQDTLLGVNFGVYGSWVPTDGAMYVESYAMGGYNNVDQTRNMNVPGLIRSATSTSDAWGAMVGAESGLNLNLGARTVLQPYISLDYGYYTNGGYSESGAGSLNLTVSSQVAQMLQPSIGTRLMNSFNVGDDVITPYVGAAFMAQVPVGSWSQNYTSSFSSSQVFSGGTGPNDQYGATFEAGLQMATKSGWTAYVSFNGAAMTNTQIYGGQIGIQLQF